MDKSERNELISVINSGWFTEAKKTKQFEDVFSKFTNCKYSCAVTSGTTGLFVGLKALGIKKNDEVIVPDLTFVASPNSIYATGARPIFVDIERESLNIDLDKIEEVITRKTKAIMTVNFNGRTTNFKRLKLIAKKNNLKIIEDAAHSLGSWYDNKHQGTIGDIGVFSFSTPKIITTGQGGMIVTNEKKLYESCMQFKDFGRGVGKKKNMLKSFEHEIIGYNFKFTEFQAGVGIAQMKKLNSRIKRKKKMFSRYHDLLSDLKDITFLKTDLKKITPWMVDILLKSGKQRDALIDFLEQNNIQTRIFYPPIHELPPYKKSGKKFKITTEISKRGLWLPSSVTLKDNEVDYICKKIRLFLKNY